MGAISILKTRLIPSLLIYEGRCIKGVKFQKYRDVGHPITLAKVYEAQGADELLLLDITASQENRPILLDLVRSAAEQCFMPLTVGGNVKNINDIRELLRSGADKVSINTAAYKNPDLIENAALEFGSQCVVISVDYKKTSKDTKEVFVSGGTEATGVDVVEWCRKIYTKGAGEILLTSINHEGLMEGYDTSTIRSVVESVGCPVIAGGGAGNLIDLVEVVTQTGASAVSAGSLFHFTDQSVVKCHSYMKQSGLDVRVS